MLLPAVRNYLLAFHKLSITPITPRYLSLSQGFAAGTLNLHDITYTLTSNLILANFSFLSLSLCRMLYLASTRLSIRRGFNCRFILSERGSHGIKIETMSGRKKAKKGRAKRETVMYTPFLLHRAGDEEGLGIVEGF